MTQAPAMQIDDKIVKVACAAFSKVYGAGLSQVDGRWKDNTEAAIRAALTAALAEREPVAVAVKSLEWKKTRYGTWEAKTGFGPSPYVVTDYREWMTPEGESHDEESMQGAFDGAQADFELRTRSALVATPPAERVEAKNRAQGLVRSMDQWRNMVPEAVAEGSQAQVEYALKDAKHDIECLWQALAALAAKPAVKADERVVEALRGAMVDQIDFLYECREFARMAPDDNVKRIRNIRADRVQERLEATRAALAAKEGRSG